MFATEEFCDACTSCTRLTKGALKSAHGHGRRLLWENPTSTDENHQTLELYSPNKPSLSKGYFNRSRTPLEEYDPNSQDSGLGVSEDSKSPANFRFVEPSGFAPKRASSILGSPRRNLSSSFSMCGGSPTTSSSDDGFLEMFQADKIDEDAHLPSGIGRLISGPLVIDKLSCVQKTPSPRKCAESHRFRRHFSENSTPVRRFFLSSSCEDHLLRGKRPLIRPSSPSSKRPKPLADLNATTPCSSRVKGTLFQYGFTRQSLTPETPVTAAAKSLGNFRLTVSDSELSIKLALQRSTQEDLIGDFSQPFALPLMPGKHQDLKAISSETLAKLISGEFGDRIGSYKIIDCRYPYEYKAGHVKGAVNLYTQEQITKELMGNRVPAKPLDPGESDKRHILVFHCEFSSERGPRLSRFLRKEDRAGNQYPWLNYPELYLLHGGYEAFFQSHCQLCEPCAYTTMLDPAHASDLKHFRAKSKTWSGAHKRTARNLSRLGF